MENGLEITAIDEEGGLHVVRINYYQWLGPIKKK